MVFSWLAQAVRRSPQSLRLTLAALIAVHWSSVPGIGVCGVAATQVASCSSADVPHRAFPVGEGPSDVAVADLNGDGNRDVIVSNYAANSISVAYVDSEGGILSIVGYPTGPGPASLAVGDFNDDGIEDFAVAIRSADSLSVFWGSRDGAQVGVGIPVPLGPEDLASGDVTGDGVPDLLSVSFVHGDTLFVFRGSATQSLSASARIALPFDGYRLATGDLNGDGIKDVAVGARSSSQIASLLGGAALDSALPEVTSIPGGAEATDIDLGDWSGDGLDDVALCVTSPTGIQFGRGLGDGRVAWVSSLSTPFPLEAVLTDLNRDGRIDIAVTTDIIDKVLVSYSDGAGTFGPPSYLQTGYLPWGVAAIDGDHDGWDDLVVVDSGAGWFDVTWLTSPGRYAGPPCEGSLVVLTPRLDPCTAPKYVDLELHAPAGVAASLIDPQTILLNGVGPLRIVRWGPSGEALDFTVETSSLSSMPQGKSIATVRACLKGGGAIEANGTAEIDPSRGAGCIASLASRIGELPVTFSLFGSAGMTPVCRIYSAPGRLVATLKASPSDPGRLLWKGLTDGGTRASTGVYFARIAAGQSQTTIKFVLLRQ